MLYKLNRNETKCQEKNLVLDNKATKDPAVPTVYAARATGCAKLSLAIMLLQVFNEATCVLDLHLTVFSPCRNQYIPILTIVEFVILHNLLDLQPIDNTSLGTPMRKHRIFLHQFLYSILLPIPFLAPSTQTLL